MNEKQAVEALVERMAEAIGCANGCYSESSWKELPDLPHKQGYRSFVRTFLRSEKDLCLKINWMMYGKKQEKYIRVADYLKEDSHGR
jgi:hypothetical protein